MRKEKLLDILACVRMGKALDNRAISAANHCGAVIEKVYSK